MYIDVYTCLLITYLLFFLFVTGKQYEKSNITPKTKRINNVKNINCKLIANTFLLLLFALYTPIVPFWYLSVLDTLFINTSIE